MRDEFTFTVRSLAIRFVAIGISIGSLDHLAPQVAAEYVTVSLAPVANAVHDWIQNLPQGSQLLGGVPFELMPISANNSWSAWVGTVEGERSPKSMILPVSIYGATAVDTLINTFWGVAESKTVSMIFLGTGGVSHFVTLTAGTDIRDWLNGHYTNTINGTTTTQVFEGVPILSGTAGRIDKQTIALPSSFANQTMTSIILIDNGLTGSDTLNPNAQRAFIYGVTVSAIPLSGDYNRDGTVDAADYTIWRDSVGEVVTPCSGADANCNGFVENAEYFTWKDHFGDTNGQAPGSGSVAGVPEPTSLTLLALVSLLTGTRLRRLL